MVKCPPDMPIGERLKLRSAPNEATGCVEWTARRDRPNGYGVLRVGPKLRKAHRLAYEEAHGPIPDGLEVCHHCDNKGCINAAHLFVGTHHENMLDMARKGRHRMPHQVGARNPQAKLDDSSVAALRAVHRLGLFSQSTLARWWGIGQQTVSQIVRRERWSHVA